MALNIQDLIYKLSVNEDFTELYNELKKTNYVKYYPDNFINYNTGAKFKVIGAGTIQDLAELLTDMQSNNIFNDDEELAIKTINHFFLDLIAACYIWDAVKSYKLLCKNKILTFNGSPDIYANKHIPNTYAITYGFDGSYHYAQTEIYVETINPKNSESVNLIIKTYINSEHIKKDWLDRSNYLQKVLVSIDKQGSVFNYYCTPISISELNVDTLTKLVEKSAIKI